eukprot:XP_001696956.1 type I metacaspase [Chlamydomonas reinhardtii]
MYGYPPPAYGAPPAGYGAPAAPSPYGAAPPYGAPPAPAYGAYGAPQPAYGAPPAPAYGGYGAPPAPAYGAQPAYGTPYGGQAQPSAYTYGQPSANPQQRPATAPAPAYMPPTTYAPAPTNGGRRRRALLVGCGYPGTREALNGCLNDVNCIKFCLMNRFGFTEQQILILRDDTRQPDFISTKANIFRGIQWLMTDQQPGDSLFFHFSGHGSQQYDRNGDEEDGYDETICPTDFRRAGQIVDDELNRMMVQPLMPNVTLHAVIDACHSGTALDLPYRAKVDHSGRWYWKGRARYDKCTRGGTAFQFGACKDSQVAADTNKLSGKAYTGAATFSFIEAIEKYGVQQTYGVLLGHMMQTLRAMNGGMVSSGATGILASLLLGSSISSGQEPVLSCDKQVDLYASRLNI